MQHQAQVQQGRQQKWFNVNKSVSLGEIIVAAATIIAAIPADAPIKLVFGSRFGKIENVIIEISAPTIPP